MNDMIVNVCTPTYNRADSYGRIARELRRHLMTKGIAVNVFAPDSPKRVVRPVLGGFLLGYPTNFSELFSGMANVGRRIAITMFESDALPRGWADVLNGVDATILPSEWLVNVFRDSGVRTPLHVIPLGISKVFRYAEDEREQPRLPYTFLAIGDRGLRKNWHLVTAAFSAAFGDDPAYRLIIKMRHRPPFGIGNKNVEILTGNYTDKAMRDLYVSADCLVFPSSGEGFGFPPREMVATGGEAIVTNWSGTADDVDQWGIGINYDLVPAWTDEPSYSPIRGVGNWAGVSLDSLVEAMRSVVQNRDDRRISARVRSKFVLSHYSWAEFAARAWQVYQGQADGNRSAAK